MVNVFVTRILPEQAIERMSQAAELNIWQEELPPPYEVLLEKARGVDGLVSLLTDRISADLMDAVGQQLKVISQVAVGVDNIDISYATQKGIPVGHTPGVLTETTADMAWALMMAAGRRIVEADRFTRAGKWKTWGLMELLGQDIYGSTLGIIGFGRIGQAVARRALGFNMRVLYTDICPNPAAEESIGAQFVSLNELLKESDFISVHTNMDDTTRDMICEEQFALMKSTAILVNTARGGIVNQQALYEALTNRQIAAAGVDVTAVEPIAMDSPLLFLENLILTPHIASASVKTRTKMAMMAAENLVAGLTGKRLPYCANPEVYEDRTKRV